MSEFHQAMRGSFTSLLSWDQLGAFWDTLRKQADQDWYIYAISETPPDAPNSSDEICRFIDEIDSLLRKEHEEDYCGIVFADNKAKPSIVKIYDPNNLGVVCGYSDNPPPPGWILSRIKPETLDHNELIPANRRRWWQKIWG